MTRMENYILKFRRPLIVLTHVVLISAAYVFAFYIRFEFKLQGEYIPLILRTLPGLILIKAAAFYYFNLYTGLWRYVSMDDLMQIIKATVISTCAFVLYIVFSHGLVGFPRSIFVLDWVLCLGFVGGIRFLSRSFRERYKPIQFQRSIRGLIIGAGEAGMLVLRELKNNLNVDVVGFIDDDPRKRGVSIHGKKVLGTRDDIKHMVNRYGVEEIIIAMPREKGSVIRDIISYCNTPGVKVKIVPGMYEILSGKKEIRLRTVQPEDLLGRESVEIDEREVEGYIRDKTILVTGAGGSIGSELVRQIAKFSPNQIILLDYNENDIYFLENELNSRKLCFDVKTVIADMTDISILKYTFSKFRPQVVFHAAAFKHVPLMEEHPASAVKNNVIGSRNLIYASEHYGVESFVLISSDKAVNPTSIMGATKRIAEMILQAKARKSRTKFIAVRFGNVLGSKGSVVPLFKKQIEDEGEVTVTHPEARRYFMSVKEAVQLVLQASAIGKGGEIFVLDMGEQIKIVDLARNLINLSGLAEGKDIPIKFVGLRPGEKLYEETLLDIEKDKATKHEKIFVVQPNDFDIKNVIKHVKELEKLANLMDIEGIVSKIEEILPSYISNGSQE